MIDASAPGAYDDLSVVTLYEVATLLTAERTATAFDATVEAATVAASR